MENLAENEAVKDTEPSSQDSALEDPFYTKRDRTSTEPQSSIVSQEANGLGIEPTSPEAENIPNFDEPPSPAISEDEATKQLYANLNAFLEQESKSAVAEVPPSPQPESQNRQSVTMPGAFNF